MSMTATETTALVAYHGTQGGGNLVVLVVFIGALATVGWMIFSTLKWRTTLTITIVGWILALGLTFGL